MSNDTTFDLKRARGHVLVCLRSFYPNAISGGVIYRNILRPVFAEMEWREALEIIRYLEDRKFIEGIASAGFHQSQTSKDRLFKLTAQGVDLASHVTTDPAIEMEF